MIKVTRITMNGERQERHLSPFHIAMVQPDTNASYREVRTTITLQGGYDMQVIETTAEINAAWIGSIRNLLAFLR